MYLDAIIGIVCNNQCYGRGCTQQMLCSVSAAVIIAAYFNPGSSPNHRQM